MEEDRFDPDLVLVDIASGGRHRVSRSAGTSACADLAGCKRGSKAAATDFGLLESSKSNAAELSFFAAVVVTGRKTHRIYEARGPSLGRQRSADGADPERGVRRNPQTDEPRKVRGIWLVLARRPPTLPLVFTGWRPRQRKRNFHHFGIGRRRARRDALDRPEYSSSDLDAGREVAAGRRA